LDGAAQPAKPAKKWNGDEAKGIRLQPDGPAARACFDLPGQILITITFLFQ
jgi:hypothetical protein